ncbi:MAG: Fic family protein [Victivallaceae bacterium]|nr:Fic family protein [Victivallaceae bacterium]
MNKDLQPLGYNELIKRYDLEVLTPWCSSWLAPQGERKTHIENNLTTEIYPPSYNPGNKLGDHLTFALKYEGVNLEILSALFKSVNQEDLMDFIKTQPTGKYTRLVWFFYEWLTGKELPLDEIKQGNYIPALDPAKYYVIDEKLSRKFKRQRVSCNLTGTIDYCPVVRKTKFLKKFEAMKLNEHAQKMIDEYPEELLYRATQYLYAKETKSSFEIERETPDKRRTARFIELLHQIEHNSISKPELIRLQKEIVDKRFALDDYRDSQNYVGQSIAPGREIVHFAAPKPENINSIMKGWIQCSLNMLESEISPVITAAIVGYGFVFLHPFDDGNGRLHRYLIHYVLGKMHFSPSGLIFPVSATMLKKMPQYDATLEHFSRELMQHVEYILDDDGEMTVSNETAQFYRYQDMTFQSEGLFEFIRDTIEDELNTELEYLNIFDQAKNRMREVVDMPDRKLDLFIRICLQNRGRISKNKTTQFSMLTSDEINKLSTIVQDVIKNIKSKR